MSSAPDLMQTLVENALVGIYLVRDGSLAYVNSAMAGLFGYEREEMESLGVEDLVFEEDRAMVADHTRRLASREAASTQYSYRALRKDKSVFIVAVSEVGVTVAGRLAVAGTLTDQTHHARREDELQHSLAEKDSLLKEIRHRMKNDLQALSSMASLQEIRLESSTARDVMLDLQGRIEAISFVHDSLYHHEPDSSLIDAESYLRQVTDNIFHVYGGSHQQIDLAFGVDPLALDLDTAAACGLIVTELVSNALKFAFHDQPSGKIEVTLKQMDEEHCRLVVRDNGKGLPSSLTLESAESEGFNLVGAFARHLNAEVEVKSRPGAQFTLTFPTPRAKLFPR